MSFARTEAGHKRSAMIDSSALVMSPCMSNVYSHDRQPLRQRFKLPYVNVQLMGSGAIGTHHCVSVLYPLANVIVCSLSWLLR